MASGAPKRGNRQFVSVGNLRGDDRVSMFLMDYAARRRLKLLGHARVVTAESDAQLLQRLAPTDYRARVERGLVVRVAAFDWNCPQHITSRYTRGEAEARSSRKAHSSAISS
jgi:predicted pyridoxine 5'-phosphate oxidase superfamily flavin-nucleotide-binding protein